LLSQIQILYRYAPAETFQVIIGSDLLYDVSHAAPLAACVARRLDRAGGGRAHVTLPVRKGEMVAALALAARRRGLLVAGRRYF
jgi:hypothetical protein